MIKTEKDLRMKELFAANLSELCVADGRPNGELARLIGITPSWLCRYKRGASTPGAIILCNITRTLDINMRRLFMTKEEWVDFKDSDDKSKDRAIQVAIGRVINNSREELK